MAKKPLSKIPNWVIGLAVTLAFVVLYMLGARGSVGFLKDIELKTYDLRMKHFTKKLESDSVAIVAIDAQSISKLGRWPWPRNVMSQMVEKLTANGAVVIGLNVLFTEPEEGGGLKAVKAINEEFAALKIASTDEGSAFQANLLKYETDFDNDSKLEAAIGGAGNVVLPIVFDLSSRPGKLPDPPEFVLKGAMTEAAKANESYFATPEASGILYPVEKIGRGALTVGHLNKIPGRFRDGIDRWEALVVEYNGKYYPSFALSVAAAAAGFAGSNVTIDLRPDSGGLFLGNDPILTDDNFGILINYYDPKTSFPEYSFVDVLNDKVSPSVFKDKIVLIGMTDIGLGDTSPTPISPLYSGVAREATIIENILSGTTVVQPWWSHLLGLVAIIVFGAVTTVLLSRFKAIIGTAVTAALLVVYVGFAFFIFNSQSLWVELTHPALILVVNYLALMSKRFWLTEEAMSAAESESDEANKLLGLTFQSKGMLEMAFEKFKKLPVNEEMKDILYNLGLDFEKKRSWAQAVSAFERIGDAKYKDLAQRMERVKSYGSGGGPVRLNNDSATIINTGGEMPTLGRYEIIRELGRGAMGVVYLGKDPKINRQVALKTVNFDEVEEKMIPVLKDRFFREAQSAGTLSHPNIMTIYDAGEDGSLAYIAMELLDGKDLVDWTKKEKLLPYKDALLTVAKVGDALDYAHSHGIVHRDIKPANIMVTKKNEIKVADFGIARIQSASATKTGTVMGTPSYMSPEQVAGQKVDGRSDIFSLGVVLYELLTSERPFTGDSIATIMYNITNSAPTPVAKYNPKLPQYCQQLIDKALAKNIEQRFKTAGEFAQAIRWCINKYENNK